MRKTNRKNFINNTTIVEVNDKSFEIQTFFIDLDGTTIDKIRKKISKKNIDAIKQKNKYVPVVISTGRSFGNKVKKIMNLLGVEYAICQNGSVIGDDQGNILLDIKLDEKQVRDVVEVAKKYNLCFTINSKFILYSNKKILAFCRLFFRKKFKKIDEFVISNSHVNKIVLAGKTKNKINKIHKQIKDEIKDVSMKTSANDLIIEITHKDATKGNGAKFISNKLNVDLKKSVHIGDSQNDTTTLDMVGALIAMKNSSNKLLDVATHIGPSYRRGGLAKVLNGEFKEIKR